MILSRAAKAVVFDMDGLLIDTERLYLEVMTDLAARREIDAPQSIFHAMIGTSWANGARIMRAHFGESFDAPEFFRETVARFQVLARSGITLKPGVIEILDYLRETGVPCAIATTSLREEVHSYVGQHGLLERFRAIVAKHDYKNGKPEPEPYLVAAERLGVLPRDCLALEDSYNGVRSAAAAGMMTIMVPDLLEPTEEMRTRCLRIASDLHEVLGILTTEV